MKQRIIVFCLIMMNQVSFAQSVGIGTNTPNASAKLEIASTSQGVLIPRMTTVQRDAIATPAVGLQVFNLDDACIDIYDGSNWIKTCGLKVTGTVPDPGHPTTNSWVAKANFSNAREAAVAFSIGNKGYMGTGYDGVRKNDFWEYDPVTNNWTQKADFSGTARVFATGFSIDNKGYIGAGEDATGYKKDFWEFNPATNTWMQKEDFGGAARVNAVGFAIGSKGYMGTGYSFFNDLWEYNPVANTWTRKADFPAGNTSDAVGFSIGSKGYVGTGVDGSFNRKNDFWEYDPSLDRWTQKEDFGGTARNFAAGFSIGTKGYIGTGNDGTNKKDFWQYDPASIANGNDVNGNPKGEWINKMDFLGTARFKAKGFSVGKKGYILTGWDGGYKNDVFEYMDDNTVGNAYSSITPSLSASDLITIGGWTAGNDNSLYNANSGNVGIGTTTPDVSAKLHVSSSTQGFLPPRMTAAQRDVIVSPAAGLMIYCTNCGIKGEWQGFNGTAWTNMIGGAVSQPLVIGSNYGGGKIAYILQPGDPGYIAGQTHGLIAAVSDQSAGAIWGCSGTLIPGADRTELGTGNQNTIDIMAGCATAGIAARICGDLVLNGYDDWYLPSRDELSMLAFNRAAIGGFSNITYYWSSSEIDNVSAHSQIIHNRGGLFKNDAGLIRAVRSF